MKKCCTLFVCQCFACACGLGVFGAGYAQVMELDCMIEPEMTVELSSSVDGILQSISVDKSDHVVKGQVLARLESDVEQTVVDFARLRSEMNEEIQSKLLQRDLAQRRKDRVVELYHKKSVPAFEKDDVETEARLAELELVRAYNGKKLAGLELKRAVADLNLRSIVSPLDGVVVDRFANPGESVKDRPLLKLAQIDPMRIEIIAPGELFGLIENGTDAEVTAEGREKTVHRAQVTLIDSIVDAASGTFGVRLSLPNADNKIVAGVKCSARFDLPN